MNPKLVTVAVRRAVSVLGPIALTLLAGCSGDPNAGGELRVVRTYPAQGTVRLPEGKPLTPGTIALLPIVEKGLIAQAAVPLVGMLSSQPAATVGPGPNDPNPWARK